MVRMSDEARDQWAEVARRHGVTMSALLEAMAPHLPPEGEKLTPRAEAIVAHARAIDAERRRRG